jgi:4a-hydroxytetrahydrobiopterin dehydratase
MAETETSYTQDQIEQKLTGELSEWEYREGWIRRKYKTGGWPHTLMAVNALGYICEAACHHPDLLVSYAEVHVKLMTHSAGGITDKDLEVAKLIEAHLPWLPGADSALDGYETAMKKKWVR